MVVRFKINETEGQVLYKLVHFITLKKDDLIRNYVPG